MDQHLLMDVEAALKHASYTCKDVDGDVRYLYDEWRHSWDHWNKNGRIGERPARPDKRLIQHKLFSSSYSDFLTNVSNRLFVVLKNLGELEAASPEEEARLLASLEKKAADLETLGIRATRRLRDELAQAELTDKDARDRQRIIAALTRLEPELQTLADALWAVTAQLDRPAAIADVPALMKNVRDAEGLLEGGYRETSADYLRQLNRWLANPSHPRPVWGQRFPIQDYPAFDVLKHAQGNDLGLLPTYLDRLEESDTVEKRLRELHDIDHVGERVGSRVLPALKNLKKEVEEAVVGPAKEAERQQILDAIDVLTPCYRRLGSHLRRLSAQGQRVAETFSPSDHEILRAFLDWRSAEIQKLYFD